MADVLGQGVGQPAKPVPVAPSDLLTQADAIHLTGTPLRTRTHSMQAVSCTSAERGLSPPALSECVPSWGVQAASDPPLLSGSVNLRAHRLSCPAEPVRSAGLREALAQWQAAPGQWWIGASLTPPAEPAVRNAHHCREDAFT
ncbi:hypothetical protein AOLI_G00296180 [Acnodon oligacanthus]